MTNHSAQQQLGMFRPGVDLNREGSIPRITVETFQEAKTAAVSGQMTQTRLE